jgi:hypothetical protein
VVVLAGTVSADQGLGALAASSGLAVDVRAALAHGSPSDAAHLVDASKEPAASKEFATALVEIYQGKDTEARARLAKLADAGAASDTAVELAQIDMRHGRRPEARTRFQAIENARALRTSADLARIAAAGEALGDQQLAFDAYVAGEGLPSADLQTREGNFLLNRHRPADALVCFDRALKIDSRWVPAIVGRAIAFHDDDPVVAAHDLELAARIAPDDPQVLQVTAERAIDYEDWAAATKAIDRLAAVKPGTTIEQGLRAAVAVATDHPEVVEAAAERAKAIDPLSAIAYVKAGEELAQLYRADEAVVLYKKGVAIDPADRDGQFDLGMAQLRTADEAGARQTLEAAWALDRFNAQTKNSLDMLDRLEQFTVVPDGDLIFKFDKAEAPVMRLYALPLAQEAMRTFEQHYQFKPKGPILLEIFPKHDDFAVRTIGLPGIEGALGACFGRVVAMDSPHARPPDEFSWQATEWHELAHVFTLQMSNYRVPRWLTEGISVFEEHRRNPAWGREVALQYAALWAQNKTFGVKGLPNAFKDPENFTISYFEASLVVEHLVELKGDAGLRDLLLAYASGAKDEEAFAKAFGQSVDAVDASFRAWVNTHYGPLVAAMKQLAGPPIAPTDVAALRQRAAASPGSYVAQASLGQALLQSGDDKGATPVLQKAAELAPPAQGKSSPHLLLSQIAVRAGDNATARKELRAFLTYDHDSVTAARELTKLATDAHNDVDLDYGLQVTTDLDPFDAEAHTASGLRELAAKKAANALVDFQATAALNPTNPAEAHANVADALVALHRNDEAKREALTALKDAPTFAKAQDLLLAAAPTEAAAATDASAAPTAGAATAARPAGERYAVVVEGVSGDDTYAKQHRGWLDGMVGVLKGKLGFDAGHLSVLAETPGAGEQKATAEVVKTVFAGLAPKVKANDMLFVMLIGHGTGEGADVKFNLVGPDLSAEEWAAIVAPIKGRLVFVDASSSSSPFVKALAGPNRVIITATRTVSERFHTVFADGFIRAFSTTEADLDKNGRISIWEAFAYASKQVAAHYEQEGHISTEHALIDDTGQGTGHDATTNAASDSAAALTFLDAVATPTTSDPTLQGMYDRQRALSDEIDALRRRRSSMPPDEFDKAFEPLALRLSAISHDIRARDRR